MGNCGTGLKVPAVKAALAGFFVTFMNGLRVAAKTDPDERTLTQRVQVALTVLD